MLLASLASKRLASSQIFVNSVNRERYLPWVNLSRGDEIGSLCANQSSELEQTLFSCSFISFVQELKTHLSTPAQPQDSPFLDTGELGLGLGDGSLDLGDHFWRRGVVDKECAKGSLLLLSVRRDPRVFGIDAL